MRSNPERALLEGRSLPLMVDPSDLAPLADCGDVVQVRAAVLSSDK
jgi:hypothetical protein